MPEYPWMVKLWSNDGTKLVAEASTLPYKHWPDILLWGSRYFVKTEDLTALGEPTPKYCERFCGVVGIYEKMSLLADPSSIVDPHPPSDSESPPGNSALPEVDGDAVIQGLPLDAEIEMLQDPGSFDKATTDGNPPADGHWDKPAPKPLKEDGQHGAYWILPESERAKGFIRPVRRSYIHTVCGALTTMGQAIAETFARNPKYYSDTLCIKCGVHLPVDQFVWDGTGPAVITDPNNWEGFERVGT